MAEKRRKIAVRPRRLALMEELWMKHSLEITINDVDSTASKLRLVEICYDEEDEQLIDWLEFKAEVLENNEEMFNRQKYCNNEYYVPAP